MLFKEQANMHNFSKKTKENPLRKSSLKLQKVLTRHLGCLVACYKWAFRNNLWELSMLNHSSLGRTLFSSGWQAKLSHLSPIPTFSPPVTLKDPTTGWHLEMKGAFCTDGSLQLNESRLAGATTCCHNHRFTCTNLKHLPSTTPNDWLNAVIHLHQNCNGPHSIRRT